MEESQENGAELSTDGAQEKRLVTASGNRYRHQINVLKILVTRSIPSLFLIVVSGSLLLAIIFPYVYFTANFLLLVLPIIIVLAVIMLVVGSTFCLTHSLKSNNGYVRIGGKLVIGALALVGLTYSRLISRTIALGIIYLMDLRKLGALGFLVAIYALYFLLKWAASESQEYNPRGRLLLISVVLSFITLAVVNESPNIPPKNWHIEYRWTWDSPDAYAVPN